MKILIVLPLLLSACWRKSEVSEHRIIEYYQDSYEPSTEEFIDLDPLQPLPPLEELIVVAQDDDTLKPLTQEEIKPSLIQENVIEESHQDISVNKWNRPLRNATIKSGYKDTEFTSRDVQDVFPMREGKVFKVIPQSNQVLIKHTLDGKSWITAYKNLSTINVKEKQNVDLSTVIGRGKKINVQAVLILDKNKKRNVVIDDKFLQK